MKQSIFVTVLIVIFYTSFAFSNATKKEEQSSNPVPQKLDIYLLIGQSNMAGRAEVKGADKDTLNNVYLFTGMVGNEWEKAANPLNKYSSIRKKMSMQKMGPGYHFAKKMSKEGKLIGLVVNAKGGTKIEQWLPGTEFYNEATERTKEALKYGELKGIVWHQGEANASKYMEYPQKIKTLIEAFRSEFNTPNLPVVVGQIAEDKPNRSNFNKMLLTLPTQINSTGVVKRKGTKTTDGSHFDAKSQQRLGKRYAKEMIKLLNN